MLKDGMHDSIDIDDINVWEDKSKIQFTTTGDFLGGTLNQLIVHLTTVQGILLLVFVVGGISVVIDFFCWYFFLKSLRINFVVGIVVGGILVVIGFLH